MHYYNAASLPTVAVSGVVGVVVVRVANAGALERDR